MTQIARLRGWAGRDPATALLLGQADLWQLARPLADLYHLGFFDGQASLEQALREAESAADRYYRRAFGPQRARVGVPNVSFAALCRIRGELGRAEAAELSLARRIGAQSEGG